MDVTVAVGTFGEQRWADLAYQRALPSAAQMGAPTVHVHHPTSLHQARNQALDRVDTEWVCFLDADDELEGGYFVHMGRAAADVRAPSVRYVAPGGFPYPAVMPKVFGHTHRCDAACIPHGNWLVIGSCVRAELVRKVGGFRDWEMFEDWDLWARCWLEGATFQAVDDAVYRAYIHPDSRNRRNRIAGPAVHRLIAADLGLPIP